MAQSLAGDALAAATFADSAEASTLTTCRSYLAQFYEFAIERSADPAAIIPLKLLCDWAYELVMCE